MLWHSVYLPLEGPLEKMRKKPYFENVQDFCLKWTFNEILIISSLKLFRMQSRKILENIQHELISLGNRWKYSAAWLEPDVQRSLQSDSLLIKAMWLTQSRRSGCWGWGGGFWGVLSGLNIEGSGCLKVKGRVANWGGSKLMSFSVPLPALDWWHHLAVLSINSPSSPHTAKPSSSLPFFSCSHLHCREKEEKKQEKTVYFRTGLLIYLDWA